jgi:hypothetical protein
VVGGGAGAGGIPGAGSGDGLGVSLEGVIHDEVPGRRVIVGVLTTPAGTVAIGGTGVIGDGRGSMGLGVGLGGCPAGASQADTPGRVGREAFFRSEGIPSVTFRSSLSERDFGAALVEERAGR